MNTTRNVMVGVAAVALAIVLVQAFAPMYAWGQGSTMGDGNGQMSGNGCPMNGQGMMNGGMMGMDQQQMGSQQCPHQNGQQMMKGQNHQQCQQRMNGNQMSKEQCQGMQQNCHA